MEVEKIRANAKDTQCRGGEVCIGFEKRTCVEGMIEFEKSSEGRLEERIMIFVVVQISLPLMLWKNNRH